MKLELPSDRAVPISVNQGAPAVLHDSGSDFAKAIEVLAKAVLPQQGSAKPRRRLSLSRS